MTPHVRLPQVSRDLKDERKNWWSKDHQFFLLGGRLLRCLTAEPDSFLLAQHIRHGDRRGIVRGLRRQPEDVLHGAEQ